MPETPEDLARAAALGLAAAHGEALPLEVEKRIQASTSDAPAPEQYVSLGEAAAIAGIAGLTVQVAHIAWAEWKARGGKDDGGGGLGREIRIKIDAPETLPASTLDAIVAAVIKELKG